MKMGKPNASCARRKRTAILQKVRFATTALLENPPIQRMVPCRARIVWGGPLVPLVRVAKLVNFVLAVIWIHLCATDVRVDGLRPMKV